MQPRDSIYRESEGLEGRIEDLVLVCPGRLDGANQTRDLLFLGPVLNGVPQDWRAQKAGWPADVVAASRCGYYQYDCHFPQPFI